MDLPAAGLQYQGSGMDEIMYKMDVRPSEGSGNLCVDFFAFHVGPFLWNACVPLRGDPAFECTNCFP